MYLQCSIKCLTSLKSGLTTTMKQDVQTGKCLVAKQCLIAKHFPFEQGFRQDTGYRRNTKKQDS